MAQNVSSEEEKYRSLVCHTGKSSQQRPLSDFRICKTQTYISYKPFITCQTELLCKKSRT